MPGRSGVTRNIVLVILGAPGAGKGTQCARLAQTLAIPHVSTGNILRNHINRRSDLGVCVKEIVDIGGLVPDSLMLDVLDQRIRHSDCAEGFILDGFPRTQAQAVALDSRHAASGKIATLAIHLIVSEGALLGRLAARQVCPSCGVSYGDCGEPPKTLGICDLDGSTLVVRVDDVADTVRRRLLNYQQQISPIIEHYSSCGALLTVDGDQATHSVTAEVLKEIHSFRKRHCPVNASLQSM